MSRKISGDDVQDSEHENTGDPLYVQKRLKQQKRAHDREMREMQARMAEMQSQMQPKQDQNYKLIPTLNRVKIIREAQMRQFTRQSALRSNRGTWKSVKRKMHNQRSIFAKQYQDLNKHLDKTCR